MGFVHGCSSIFLGIFSVIRVRISEYVLLRNKENRFVHAKARFVYSRDLCRNIEYRHAERRGWANDLPRA